MPFKSKAQHRKFRAMLDEGKISKKEFNEMMKETKKKHGKEDPIKSLPEKVSSAFIRGFYKEAKSVAEKKEPKPVSEKQRMLIEKTKGNALLGLIQNRKEYDLQEANEQFI